MFCKQSSVPPAIVDDVAAAAAAMKTMFCAHQRWRRSKLLCLALEQNSCQAFMELHLAQRTRISLA
eukprot:3790258-Amphidinium_carterae.1